VHYYDDESQKHDEKKKNDGCGHFHVHEMTYGILPFVLYTILVF
jgi:hypothetical protein